RRRHTSFSRDWSSDVCSSDLGKVGQRWSLTYAAEYLAREEIFASQRDFMDSYRDDPSVDPEDAVATIGIRMRDRLVGTGLASYIDRKSVVEGKRRADERGWGS